MIDRLYTYRFELFLITQLFILFGSLFIPIQLFENWIMPIFLLFNIVSGVLLVCKNRKSSFFILVFIGLFITGLIANILNSGDNDSFNYIKLASYFIFYGLVTIEIIIQVWKAKLVGKNVILGLISGYISLGLLSFFMCLSIEIIYPNSFSGLMLDNGEMTESLMYYSYITLMTIGYGDILPITPIAQKASVFIGLIGQFYLVILTAIVVGKYINQKNRT
ncbi:ion channel [Winogradskyella sp. PG-2]|uniref:ion channel n=1 Tax=Winogradskyella sp. PG-2 TaxID=754409 RepID=UPI0004588AC8|nr:ion channel [Winogradskyella sp. PG-2]BAO74950.1 potassium channel protein [Winogradskyella sp. PG-2]